MRRKKQQTPRAKGRLACGLALAVSLGLLSGCKALLDVQVPGQITEGGLYTPSQASILVNSAIGNIECGYSDFIAATGSGAADVYLKPWAFWGNSHTYAPIVATGNCNDGQYTWGWWSPMQAGRYQAEQAYANLQKWTDDEVKPANRKQLLAQAAIYSAIPYGLFGEVLCEVSYEKGPLMSWDQSLANAEKLLTDALGHVTSAGGDFALPYGISPSANQMARLLRARYRLARGNKAGAAEDARSITKGFKAYITRDAVGERKRWNRINNGHNGDGLGTVSGPITWWTGPGNWGNPIPFTGYQNLGVMPDGRAISDGNPQAITTTANTTAVADPRVQVYLQGLTNGYPWWRTRKYVDNGDDMPLVSWEEAWLILAEIEGGQGAIDRVNDIRATYKLPLVTYANPNNPEQIKNMVIEEWRRSLFLEGTGFWTVKLRHKLWFPRRVGGSPGVNGIAYEGGVRMVMPELEFQLNPNADLSKRGSMCSADERPLI
jgi:hypothetical protein